MSMAFDRLPATPDGPVLLTSRQTPLTPHEFVASVGWVFVVFDNRTQDSGNTSYGVESAGRRYFVKTAGAPTDVRPMLSFEDRVALMRNVASIHARVTHPALVPLRNVIDSAEGPVLVFDWVAGEVIGAPQAMRSDPSSAYFRFHRLPVPSVLQALDDIISLHRELASKGYVAGDFYDGSLLYDFEQARLHVIDLDSYHAGPFINRMGRMFGSTRFMAPEEFQAGAEITEATTVFTLGRAIIELLSDPINTEFRGRVAELDVAARATRGTPAERYASVNAMSEAWERARRTTPAARG